MRSPYCEAAGTGAGGGGPVAVTGKGMAVLGAVVWRHRSDGEERERDFMAIAIVQVSKSMFF